MSKTKNYRTYTPGKNDFLNFANTMNKNVLVDFKKNRENTVEPAGTVATLPSSDINDLGLKEPKDTTTSTISTTIPTVSTTEAKKDYSQWLAANGYNAENEYLQAKAALDYDYNTQMSTYGANAERLYQMGLSNAGVSDIFGADAYSAYLAAQNNLYADKIARENQYKQGYNAYLSEYDAAVKENNQKALAFASGIYDGYNLDYVKRALSANGYDQTAIDHVMTSLNTLGSDEIKAGTVQGLYSNIATAFPNYTGSEEEKQAIRNLYGKTNSEEALNEAITMLDSTLNVANAQKRKEFDAWLSTYAIDTEGASTWQGSTSEKTALREQLILNGYTEADADYAISVLDNRKTQMDLAAATDVSNTIRNLDVSTGEVTFNDLTTSLEQAKSTFGENSDAYRQTQATISSKIKETIDWVLGGGEERLGGAEAAAILGIEGYSDMKPGEQEGAIITKAGEFKKNGYLSSEDYNALISTWISSEVDAYTEKDKKNLTGTAISDYSNIAYNLSEWRNAGYMTEDEYNSHMTSLINESGMTLLSASMGTIVGTASLSDKHLAGNVLMLGPNILSDLFNVNIDTNNAIDALDKSGELNTININTSTGLGRVTGNNVAYALTGGPLGVLNPVKQISATTIGNILGAMVDAHSTLRVTEYNGKLYINMVPDVINKIKGYIPNDSKLAFIKNTTNGVWVEMSPETIHSLGDLVINNENQKQGTYDMIAAMIKQGDIIDKDTAQSTGKNIMDSISDIVSEKVRK